MEAHISILFDRHLETFFEEKEDKLIKTLYEFTAPFGNFSRRIFFEVEGDKYEILSLSSIKEYISKEQLKNIKEMCEMGKLTVGSTKCSLIENEFIFKNHPLKWFWIVSSSKTNEAKSLIPFITLFILKILNLREKKDVQILESLSTILNDLIQFLDGEIPFFISQRFYEFFSLLKKTMILGFKEGNLYKIYSYFEKLDLKREKLLMEDELQFLKNFKNIVLEPSTEEHRKICKLFEIETEKGLKILFDEIKTRPISFLIFEYEKSNISSQYVDIFFNFVSSIIKFKTIVDEKEEKRKELGETFKLVVERSELRDKILNHLDIAILVLTKNCDILYSNHFCKTLLGITPFELSEKKVLKSKEPGKSIYAMVTKVIEENKDYNGIIKINERSLELSVTPLSNESFLIVGIDRTEHEKESEERRVLFSLITHEVKNPLASLLSASDMLYSKRAEELNDEQKYKLYEIIYKNAKEMKEILEDVSSFGKALFGMGIENPISLKDLTLKILEDKKDIIKTKELLFFLELNDISILCQKGMAETMLINIIGNAIKYSSMKGKIGIRLNLKGDKIVYEVIDDGIGIPEEDLPKIGEPFFRAENVRDSISGTGFGLSVVKNIVLRLKGSFNVVSPISREDRLFIQCKNPSHRGTKIALSFPITILGGKK